MNRRTWAAFTGLLALCLGVLVPLQLALEWTGLADRGLSARAAEGSVWHGNLRGVQWRGKPVGNLQVQLQPLPLLAGTRATKLEADTYNLQLLQGRRNGVQALDGTVVLGGLPGLQGVTLELEFARFALVFANGRCLRAEGMVQAGLKLPGEGNAVSLLSGQPQCVERAALIPLRSETGSARLEVDLRIEADGRYRLQAVVRDADPATTALLGAAGFLQGPAGLSRDASGHVLD